MILAANQPYFLPYFPYWQLIHSADRFLLGDDYAFMKGGWIARNRILVHDAPQYFRIEVHQKSCSRLICDTQVMPLRPDNKLRTLEMAYRKAPYFAEAFPVLAGILRNPQPNLALFLEDSIRGICAYLGITTPIGRTSELPGNRQMKREARIYDFCHRLNADTYINAIGGRTLYQVPAFAREGIRLRFLQSGIAPYPQFGGPFVDKLSVVDAMMFLSRERLHAMLDEYVLLDE